MRRKNNSLFDFGYSSRRKKSKIKYIFIIFLILVVSGSLFIYFNGSSGYKKFVYSFYKKDNKVKEVKKIKNTKKVVEIQEYVKKRDYSPLKKELETFLKNNKGTWGIYFCNSDGNGEFGINDTEEYQAASTIKIPINFMLFEKVAAGQEKLENTVIYEAGDKEGGTGRIQYSEIGKVYTLRELSKLALTESDNVAINMISKHFGRAKVYKEFMKNKGAKWVDLNRNVTSPRDLGIFLKGIYQFSIKNPKLGNELLTNMKNSMPNDRLQKLLPKNIKVAHKVGNYIRAYHDVGIVFTKLPYILCVMSKDVSGEAENFDIIAKISKKVYDYSFIIEKQDNIEKEKKRREDQKKNKLSGQKKNKK